MPGVDTDGSRCDTRVKQGNERRGVQFGRNLRAWQRLRKTPGQYQRGRARKKISPRADVHLDTPMSAKHYLVRMARMHRTRSILTCNLHSPRECGQMSRPAQGGRHDGDRGRLNNHGHSVCSRQYLHKTRRSWEAAALRRSLSCAVCARGRSLPAIHRWRGIEKKRQSEKADS